MALFILRCKQCRAAKRIDAAKTGYRRWATPDGRTYDAGGTAQDWLSLPCACGGHLLGRKVKGYVTEQPCNAKCTSAVGHLCECSCGGANHGAVHA